MKTSEELAIDWIKMPAHSSLVDFIEAVKQDAKADAQKELAEKGAYKIGYADGLKEGWENGIREAEKVAQEIITYTRCSGDIRHSTALSLKDKLTIAVLSKLIAAKAEHEATIASTEATEQLYQKAKLENLKKDNLKTEQDLPQTPKQ